MVMGHQDHGQKNRPALECVGFQTIFARAVEWAATQRVTLPIPADFPSATEVSIAKPSFRKKRKRKRTKPAKAKR